MATTPSGTVGATIWTVQKVIDNAYRLCRVPTGNITAELLDMARDQISLMLYEYVNDFTPMWCVDSVLVGMNQGNARVLLPQGTVEVHNANLRVPAIYTGTDTVSLGGITRDFGVGVTNLVTTIGYLPPVGAPATLQFIVETSDDGVTFTNCYTGSLLTIVVGTWVWFNIIVPIPHRYYRVRDNTAQTVASSAVYTCGTPVSITPLARLNEDQWANLSNRQQQGRPLQFWLQRTVDPSGTGDDIYMNLYYTPDATAQNSQLEVFRHRYPNDVGTYQNSLEVPNRWYRAFVDDLAFRVSKEIKDVPPDWVDKLEGWAQQSRMLARTEERDNSPFSMLPMISGYTR